MQELTKEQFFKVLDDNYDKDFYNNHKLKMIPCWVSYKSSKDEKYYGSFKNVDENFVRDNDIRILYDEQYGKFDIFCINLVYDPETYRTKEKEDIKEIDND